jgi:hypothetical protein
MSERLDPEEVKEITGKIFDEVSKIISKYEGFVEKFAGDAVMALFGATEAHEDDPVRAIKAAREIHNLVNSLSPQYEERIEQPLVMHSGINTGLVVTGEINLEKGTHGVAMEIVKAFGAAAKRAEEAGADGIQLHGAHGYLINEFLSPFFNSRTDSWGDSDENRFRFLKEIVLKTQQTVPEGMPVLIKLSTNDYTPKEGITPSLAAKYAEWLAELRIDGLETSCGTSNYSYMNMCRGDVPTDEFLKALPWWKKPVGRLMIGKLEGKYDLEEGYNLEAARMIKPVLGDTPLILVGGMRTVSHMEEVLESGHADFISMSRPFIREPFLANKKMRSSTFF